MESIYDLFRGLTDLSVLHGPLRWLYPSCIYTMTEYNLVKEEPRDTDSQEKRERERDRKRERDLVIV